MRQILSPILLVLLALATVSCTATRWESHFYAVEDPALEQRSDTFLELHGNAGEVWLLETWEVQRAQMIFTGTGRSYTASRIEAGEGEFEVPFSDVAMAETLSPQAVVLSGTVILGTVTVLSAALSTVCLTSDGGCWFYATGGIE